jgi:hypothetical protein
MMSRLGMLIGPGPIRSRLVMVLALMLAAAAVGSAIGRLAESTTSTPPAAHASLTPATAAYLGVFEPDAPPGYASVSGFAQAAGRQPNLLGYYSGWAAPFDTGFAQMIQKRGVIPFVQIDPTDASVQQIAKGTYDDYLRSYADSVRAFGHAVVIGFGHEMNAPWYSWGFGHIAPATFVAAWQHVVTVFHQEGADNVTWLWTLQADEPGTGPISSWWPGAQYVTWVGIDGYYYRPSDSFSKVFGKTITQVRTFTDKPVLLSETAVGPGVGVDNEYSAIQNLFRGMATYKTLGLVWFDKAQHDGIYHQDWRLEDNQNAEISFHLGVSRELAPNPSS